MTILPNGYDALVQRAAYRVDVDAGHFEATGTDATAYINRVVTADLSRLLPSHSTHTLLLREDGSIQARLLVHRFGDRILLVCSAAARVEVWHELVARKRGQVRLRDVSGETTMIRVAGPQSETLLKHHLVPLPTEAGTIGAARCGGTELFAAHALPGWPEGFSLHCRARDTNLLLKMLENAGIPLAGDEAWEILRMEWGIAQVGMEIDPSDTPLEAGLEDLVHEAKGAPFPGEAAVAARRRTGAMKRLVGVHVEGDVPPLVGANVQLGGHDVGRVRSLVVSPRAGIIGFIAVPTSATAAGTPVVLSVGIQQWDAEVRRPPFVSRSVA